MSSFPKLVRLEHAMEVNHAELRQTTPPQLPSLLELPRMEHGSALLKVLQRF